MVLIVAIAAFQPSLGAQSSDEERLARIEAEIDALKDQIQSAQATRTEYLRQLEETQARLDVLLADLRAAQSALDVINTDIANQEAVIAETEHAIELLTAELAATQLDKRNTRVTVQDRAVDMYMNGVFGAGSAMFAMDDAANLSVGYEYAENLLTDTEVLLRSLEVLEIQETRQRERLDEERAAQDAALAVLEQERIDAEVRRAELDLAKEGVDAEIATQESLIASINRDIALFDDQHSELENDAAALEQEIAARQSTGGSNPGILAYPVNAPITSAFGNRVHPITGAVRLHKGVDFGAGAGTPIRASGSGTVILAQWFGGFGNAVVIDHGGGLATLYAHQSGLNVSVGQTVSTGDTIGWVGSTGFSTGPHLHFETHEFGVAVNPMKYLSG
jgi:murein DD-endopeptidase MepM/ murein hydrolase activator NlpD